MLYCNNIQYWCLTRLVSSRGSRCHREMNRIRQNKRVCVRIQHEWDIHAHLCDYMRIMWPRNVQINNWYSVYCQEVWLVIILLYFKASHNSRALARSVHSYLGLKRMNEWVGTRMRAGMCLLKDRGGGVNVWSLCLCQFLLPSCSDLLQFVLGSQLNHDK